MYTLQMFTRIDQLISVLLIILNYFFIIYILFDQRCPYCIYLNMATAMSKNSLESSFSSSSSSQSVEDSDCKNELLEVRHELVDVEASLAPAVREIKDSVSRGETLAVDCEGDCLSRKGTLQLLSVATRNTVFLFDIVALKHAPFERGLRAVLESCDVKKLMFDCRGDADALLHQFNVKLQGVLDVQLLEVIQRPPSESSKTRNRSDRTDEVIHLAGLLSCLELFIKEEYLIKKKRNIIGIRDKWGVRPLSEEQIEYAKVDVFSLFMLYEKFSPDEEEKQRLVIASDQYVDLKRSIPVRDYNKYEDNPYLPINIIPAKGTTEVPTGYTACTTCRRRFPRDEFSKTQLKKRIQKCRTCRKVKLEIDVQKNREDNWARAEDSSDEYGFGDDDNDAW